MKELTLLEIEILRKIIDTYNVERGNLCMQSLEEEKAYTELLKKFKIIEGV